MVRLQLTQGSLSLHAMWRSRMEGLGMRLGMQLHIPFYKYVGRMQNEHYMGVARKVMQNPPSF